MKQDECDLITGKQIEIHPKRVEYLARKWVRRGWMGPRFDVIKNYVTNVEKVIESLDGQVVILAWKKWLPESVGIIEDHGDNGWHFYTAGTLKRNSSWYMGDYRFDDIAYVMPHPSPAKIWTKMNYLFWKYHKREDRFHQKITQMSYGTRCEYDDRGDGQLRFTYHNAHGNIGDCYPWCQCKKL